MSEKLNNNTESVGDGGGNKWEEAMKDAPEFKPAEERVDDVERARAMASVENTYRERAAHIERLASEDRENGQSTETLDKWKEETIEEGNAAAEKEGEFYDKNGHGSNDSSVTAEQLKKEMNDEEYGDLAPKVDPIDISTDHYKPGIGYDKS